MSNTPQVPIPLDAQGRLGTAYLSWTDAAGNAQILVPDLVLEETWTGNATITENPVEVGANITDNIRVELRKVTLKFYLSQEPLEPNNWTTIALTPTTLDLPSPAPASPPSPIVAVPEWQSNLEARVLIGTAAGVVAGGFGASVASLVTSFALAGRQIDVPVVVNAGQFPPDASPPPITIGIFTPSVEDDFVRLTIEWIGELKDAGQTMDVFGTKDQCVGTVQGIGGMAIEAFTWSRTQEDGTGATVTLGLKQIRVVTTQTVPAPAPSLPRAKKPTNGGNQQTSDANAALSQLGGAFMQGIKDGSADTVSLLGGGS